MDFDLFDPDSVVVQRDQLLEMLRLQLSLVDFVIVRNTLLKHVEEALRENRQFEEAIRSDSDPFVADVRDDDPLAFVLRGALHLESRVTELLGEQNVTLPQRADFNAKILLLERSGIFTEDGIQLLHEIRLLRNAVAHELEAGRSVSDENVAGVRSHLSGQRLARLTSVCGADPLILEPALLVRLVMNNIHTELEGTKRRLRWESDYRRIFPTQVTSTVGP